MLINSANLRSLYLSFNTAFQAGFAGVAPEWTRIAMEVPSSTREEEYGWLKEFPRVREWVGDRVIHQLASDGYRIKNRDFELTISVDRNDIDDDRIGIYAPMFKEMGRASAAFPDELVMPMLAAGFSTPCYDGQYFFDTDHPVLDANGVPQSVSNTGGGAGTPWYLLDTTRAVKPLILQKRKAFDFTRMDAATDEVVFERKQYRYGVDGRFNAGYGFWQLAQGSKQTLDATNYAAARAALMGRKGDYGRPLGIKAATLVVPPSLEEAGRKLLNSEYASGGETNPWKGTAELFVASWLA